MMDKMEAKLGKTKDNQAKTDVNLKEMRVSQELLREEGKTETGYPTTKC
jgi:hypothetical protein